MSDENDPILPLVPAPTPPEVDFDKVIHRLQNLMDNHKLSFRLGVGQAVLEEFFGNDIAAYHDRSNNKSASLHQFALERKDSLRKLSLSEQTLRHCILGYDAMRLFPREMVNELSFSHVVELIRVPDENTRLLLLQATITNKLDSRALKGAAEAARVGKWIDGDPIAPEIQPPEPAPSKPKKATKKLQTGHVVNGVESAVKEINRLAAHFEQEVPPKITPLQRVRLEEALGKFKDRVATIEAALARGE